MKLDRGGRKPPCASGDKVRPGRLLFIKHQSLGGSNSLTQDTHHTLFSWDEIQHRQVSPVLGCVFRNMRRGEQKDAAAARHEIVMDGER